MSFNVTIEADLKEALKPELKALDGRLQVMAKAADSFLGDLLSYVMIGSGKRVRPALVYLASQLGHANNESVQTVEEAVELIHIATLIHDDVIDRAAMRRGQKTVMNEFGVDTAILLGDHIYTTAFKHLADLGDTRIVSLLAEATAIICRGEIEQLKNRYHFDLTETEYFSFIREKTASLFGASAQAGGLLANQDEKVLRALHTYGVHLGQAFQISDDILDIAGNESIVGKTLHTDLMNGKMTLPLIHFRDQLSLSEKTSLVDHLKNPNGHLADLIFSLKKAGSVRHAEAVADLHVEKAKESLKDIPDGRVKDLFVRLADTLKRRNA